MKKIIYLLFTLYILIGLSSELKCENEEKSEYTYQKIREFKKHSDDKTWPIVKPGEIRTYELLELDTNKLTSADSQYIEKYMPGWNGEKYRVVIYKWADKYFQWDTIFYADTIGEGGIEMEDYDKEDRNLKLPDNYLKNKEMSSELHTSLVKSYAEGDLNSDSKTDFVMVYEDTSGKKAWWKNGKKDYYRFVVFENKGEGDFVKEFSYDFGTLLTYIGKLEIIEVTGDNLPEIILWTVGAGGSGYTEKLEIFSRVKK